MLELGKLEQFAVLARHRSYTTAANALHVSQPTLTRTVQSLERSLGATLFDRGRNGVSLTSIGEEFLRHAESLLQQARSIEADIADRSKGIRGHVRVAIGPFMGGHIIPKIVKAIEGSDFDITVSCVLARTHSMYSMLLDGEIDFFISRTPDPAWNDRLKSVAISHVRTSFWVRPGHPLTRKKYVSFADIAKFPRASATAWNEVLQHRVPSEVAQQISATIEVDDSGTLREIAGETDTVLVGSWMPEASKLVRLEISGDRQELFAPHPIMMSHPANRTLAPAVRYVMSIARNAASHQTL